jgi:hypothetical protein
VSTAPPVTETLVRTSVQAARESKRNLDATALGIVATLLGTAGLLWFLRLLPIDLGLVFAAGIGLGALDVPSIRQAVLRVSRSRRVAVGAAVLAGAALAMGLAPSWPRDATVRASVVNQRTKEQNAATAFAELKGFIGPVPAWRGVATPAGAGPLVLIPPRLRAQGIVDLDLPLWAGVKSSAGMIALSKGLPAAGTIVYHDTTDDKPSAAWAQVEVSVPTVVGNLRVVPLFVNAKAGIWIVRIEAAGG